MAIYRKGEWEPGKFYAGFQYSPDGETLYTAEDAEKAWRDHAPAAAGFRPKPPLERVIGKYLIVDQFSEPRVHQRPDGSWRKPDWSWNDLDASWWRMAMPQISDDPRISWGHSTWIIGTDGLLKFVGANYDSSD